MKRCYECGEQKLLAAFGKDSHAKDGLRYDCKACVNARAAQWRLDNPDRNLEVQRRYREAHPDRRKASWDSWYADNKEHVAESSRQRREENPDWFREYKATHREQSAGYEQKRRALKVGAWVEDVDYGVVFERDRGICGLCQLAVRRDNWHLDHIIPISRGGEHSYANARATHPVCNDWKFNRLDSELPPVPPRILKAAQAEAALAAA